MTEQERARFERNLTRKIMRRVDKKHQEVREQQDSIRYTLQHIQTMIQSHATGVQNVYDQFTKLEALVVKEKKVVKRYVYD